LTVARSERARRVLTHASRTRIPLNFSGVMVSKVLNKRVFGVK
jgi:hypothetical protein